MGKEKEGEVYVIGGKRGWATINYSGIFDFKGLINTITSYLVSRKYVPVGVEHSEKVMPAGREVTWEMTPFRNVTEYVRFSMDIIIIILRMVDVIVEEGSRKVKKQKGDVEFMIKASIVKNWKKAFPGSSSGEFFRQTYEKYIAKEALSSFEDKLEAEGNELIKNVKEVLHAFKE